MSDRVLHGLLQFAVKQVERQRLSHVLIGDDGQVWRKGENGWAATDLYLDEIDDRVAFLMGELPTPEDHER